MCWIYSLDEQSFLVLCFCPDRVSECGVCLQRAGCGRPAAHHTTEGDVRGCHHWELYVQLVVSHSAAALCSLKNKSDWFQEIMLTFIRAIQILTTAKHLLIINSCCHFPTEFPIFIFIWVYIHHDLIIIVCVHYFISVSSRMSI